MSMMLDVLVAWRAHAAFWPACVRSASSPATAGFCRKAPKAALMAGQSGSSPTGPQAMCIARAGAGARMPSVVACHPSVISRAGRRIAGLTQVISAATPAAISRRKAIAAMAVSRTNSGRSHGEPFVCAAKNPAKAPPIVATPVHQPTTPLVLQGPVRLSGIPVSVRPTPDVPRVSQSRVHGQVQFASEPGPLGDDCQAPFQVTGRLVHVPSDAAHRDSRSDDHVSELGQQVITRAAGPLPAVQALHADERLRGFTHLFGQLEQPDLNRDITVMRMQLANLIPHRFLRQKLRPADAGGVLGLPAETAYGASGLVMNCPAGKNFGPAGQADVR